MAKAATKAAKKAVEKAVETPASAPEASTPKNSTTPYATSSPTPDSVQLPYAVMLDGQGVAYLRVEHSEAKSRFVLNTGSAIELLEMDRATIKSRSLAVIENADILGATNLLLHPASKEITISARAKTELEKVLANKETLITMANKKAAKKSTSTTKSTKTSKAPRSTKVGRKSAATREGHTGKRAAHLEAKIVKKYDDMPYRDGSARAELLKLAVKSGTVGKFYDAAGKPSGGSASAYLGVFVRDGHLKIED